MELEVTNSDQGGPNKYGNAPRPTCCGVLFGPPWSEFVTSRSMISLGGLYKIDTQNDESKDICYLAHLSTANSKRIFELKTRFLDDIAHSSRVRASKHHYVTQTTRT